MDAQRRGKVVGAHRRAALTQEFEDALAVGNVDVVATTRRTRQRRMRPTGVRSPQFL